MPMVTSLKIVQAAALTLAICLSGGSDAHTTAATQPVFSDGAHFQQKTGEAIFHSVCQACHMPSGGGAIGAGSFPALAKNSRLAAAAYPTYVVLHGKNGMPSFADLLDDDQVSAVVGYVRDHLGNNFTDQVTADQVHKLR